tara:strand:+ start:2742 stop:2957 length:216 start_codon:yes stop_codon:yes gene_type:complete
MNNYKIECVPIYDPDYTVHPFTVFFELEEYMFDFMEIVPNTYTTRHYEQLRRGEWHLIAEIDGWRVCGDDN